MGSGIFIFPDGSGNGSSQQSILNRLSSLENETIKRGYYKIVSGTSGTISLSSGITFIQGQFGSSGDSIISQINGSNYPIYNSPTDVSGNPVTSTLNTTTGAWTTSGTYVQSQVAIFFVVTGTQINIDTFESTYTSYVRVIDIENDLTAGSGISIVTNVISIPNSGITNAMLAGSIAYSKLSLTGSILNADLAGSIADGKLASSYLYADGTRGLAGAWNAGQNITATAFIANGTSGSGYVQLSSQSSPPTAVVNNMILYSNSSNSFSLVKRNAGNTADITRAFTFPDLSVSYAFPTPGTGSSDTIACLGVAQSFTAQQTFTGSNIQIAGASLLDTTYKTVIDVQAANVVRFGNGFTTTNISTDIALGSTLDLYLNRQSSNTLRISTSSAHSTMGNLEVSKIVLVSGNTSIDGGVANIGLAIAGAGGANTTAIKIAGGSGITGTTTANYHGVMLGQSFSPASGSPSLFGIIAAPTYNIGGGTPVINAFRITPFLQSTTGASSIILFDVGTNSAALNTGTHTSLFSIDSSGNFIFSTSGGTKIGTSTSQKISLWNATPVTQPSSANQAALTDSTTGTASTTISDVGASFSQTTLNNNFASVTRLLNQLRNDLTTIGAIKGSA